MKIGSGAKTKHLGEGRKMPEITVTMTPDLMKHVRNDTVNRVQCSEPSCTAEDLFLLILKGLERGDEHVDLTLRDTSYPPLDD